MVLADVAANGAGDGQCACSLLWLKRAMEFLVQLMANLMGDRSLGMDKAFSASYDKTLKPFHGRAVQWLIYGVTKVLPSREFCEKEFGGGEDIYAPGTEFVDTCAPVLQELDTWLCANRLNHAKRA